MILILLQILSSFTYAFIFFLGTLSLISLILLYSQSNTSTTKSKSFPVESSFTNTPTTLGYFSFTRKWATIMDGRTLEMLPKPNPVLSNHPGIVKALDTWLYFITRDFIEPWYTSISSDTVFVDVLQLKIKGSLKKLIDRLVQLQGYPFLVEKFAPLFISHLMDMKKAEHLLRNANIDKVFTESKELHEFMASKYNHGKLHPCITIKKTHSDVSETSYLRNKVEALFPYLLTPHDRKSPVLRTFVREVIVGTILKPMFDLFSDPEFWYQIMDSLAGTAIKDLNLVAKFRKVLERQAHCVHQPVPMHSSKDLLKLIRQCKSLVEAKKLRNLIVMEVRRRRMVILERHPEDRVNGIKVSDMLQQVKRLLHAKAKIEQQIIELGGTSKFYTSPIPDRSMVTYHPTSLSKLLSNPTGLSYFTKFMEKKKQAHFLQFYLTAQGFREQFANPASLPAELFQEFLQIYNQFFAVNSTSFIQLPLGLSLKLNQAAIESTINKEVSNELWIDTFQCILDAQNHIFQSIEQQDLAEFLRSDVYLLLLNDSKFVTDTSPASKGLTTSLSTPPSPSSTSNSSSSSIASASSSSSSSISTSELDQIQVRLLNESDLLPTDVVETVEEELRSLLSCDLQDMSLTTTATTHPSNEEGDDEVNDNGHDDEDGIFLSHTIAPPSSSFSSSSLSPSDTDPNLMSDTDDLVNAPSSIRQEIDKLAQQEAIVDTLLEKARKDAKNKGLVKILEKSKRTVKEEIRELFWQEQQLSRSESSHIIPGKCSVKVISHSIGKSESKEFALYRIEVRQLDSAAPGWIVHRRFSEFLLLHQILKKKYPQLLQHLDLPKKVPNAFLGSRLLKKVTSERQVKLNEYLQKLSKSADVCQSDVFRRFICLDHLDRASLSMHPSKKKASFLKNVQKKFMEGWENLVYSTEPSSQSSPMDVPPSPFSDPLPDRASDMFCELFIELFDLRERNNWLRRQAVSILLQQILGETIER
ncbi:Intermediate filament protein [Coelomomyces lativittatus]|nr:Intermediate filament protein [Coelomomyces lativittatus]